MSQGERAELHRDMSRDCHGGIAAAARNWGVARQAKHETATGWNAASSQKNCVVPEHQGACHTNCCVK